MIAKLVQKYKTRQRVRFLKKNRCDTEEAYQRLTDPDIARRANTIREFYHGYEHVKEFSYVTDLCFSDNMARLDSAKNWCSTNCTDKWRHDIHRVYPQTGIGLDNSTTEELFINELASERCFFAFKKESDCAMFLLMYC